jgi:hypothetical protein
MRALPLIIAALSWCGSAAAEPVRIWFDPRVPMSRPMVQADVGGRAQAMLLDTGSTAQVWSLKRARAAHAVLGTASPLYDVDLRAHEQFPVAAVVQIPGTTLAPALLVASEWVDGGEPERRDGPRIDGILSPQLLPRDGHAIVLDLVRGQLVDEPWRQAIARVDTLPRALADVPLAKHGHFVVDAEVSGRTMRLVVDTGAPDSLVYEPRGDDLPEGAVRVAIDHRRVTVGAVRRSLVVQHREPTGDPGFDGLLGLDVLRDCALAMDKTRLYARCAAVDDIGAPGGDLSLLPKRIGLGFDGPWLEQHADGSFRYVGDGLIATVGRDGHVAFERLRGNPLAMRSEREEREWFMESTASLRQELWREDGLRSSFDRLPRLLSWVWGEPRWSPAERREILFRIWDEAAEPDDRELGDAGAHARKIIERFVRRELPAGSASGFSDEELARFNARRARGPRFDPYHPARDR